MNAGPVRRTTRRLAATRSGAWLFAHLLYRLDTPIFCLSRRRHTLASRIAGLPVVLLTTTGARTGRPRTVPVVALPTSVGTIIIASNFGQAQQPAWYYNLRSQPAATLTSRTGRSAVRAEELTGEPQERAWREATAVFPGWSAYKHRAGTRHIALFRLEPSRTNEAGSATRGRQVGCPAAERGTGTTRASRRSLTRGRCSA
jgi:deazaflavin-dependent oxidoreductase (nitroreductase family)